MLPPRGGDATFYMRRSNSITARLFIEFVVLIIKTLLKNKKDFTINEELYEIPFLLCSLFLKPSSKHFIAFDVVFKDSTPGTPDQWPHILA